MTTVAELILRMNTRYAAAVGVLCAEIKSDVREIQQATYNAVFDAMIGLCEDLNDRGEGAFECAVEIAKVRNALNETWAANDPVQVCFDPPDNVIQFPIKRNDNHAAPIR